MSGQAMILFMFPFFRRVRKAYAVRTFYCLDFDVFPRQETGVLTAEYIAELV